jgi:hypothetical protein
MTRKIPINIDIGLIIRERMSEQGTSTAWLARQVDYDRSNLWKRLQDKHIYPELLLKISIALKTDFFVYYSQYLVHIIENKQNNSSNTP